MSDARQNADRYDSFRAAGSSDAELRVRALDPAESWMLQAPAGSGKTELLMQRYLACLATVEQPESVLAITFTRKAAAEMRSRILAALELAATEDAALELAALEDGRTPSGEPMATLAPHRRQSIALARAVLHASDARGWKLLSQPSRLQVRTLDSFCEAVAQRAPCRGELGGAAQVTENAQPLYELAAERVLDELAGEGTRAEAVATLLVSLDNNPSVARSLLAGMLAQRDQWLHFLGASNALDAREQQELRGRLEQALALSVEEQLRAIRASCAAALSSEQAAELMALLRHSSAQLDVEQSASPLSTSPQAKYSQAQPPIAAIAASAAAAADCGPAALESIAESIPTGQRRESGIHASCGEGICSDASRESADWPVATSDALPEWRAIADFLLTSANAALRKAVNKNNGFPSDTKQQKVIKKRCTDLLAEIALLPAAGSLADALHRVRSLPDPRYSEEQWRRMLALLELLPLAAAHLRVVFSEQAAIDFAEYAQRALDAIGKEGSPSELGLQLGYRIRHVLVDEFQDTSHVQVELLSRLLQTWEADEACSTFFVGDPMQSIYSFRQADVAIYQQVRREGIAGRPANFGCLRQNFRSQRNLVLWFNQVFARILSGESDATNAVRYESAEAALPALEGPEVRIQGFRAGDRSGEARHLAGCIRRELEQATAADAQLSIAILVRSRSHLPELAEALREAQIPYRAVKTDRLGELPLVRDLEALRVALTDLADRTAWLAVLRAPWCGLKLADLLELCRGDEHSTVRELLRERGEQLSAEARAALARCLPVLDGALERRGRGALRARLESAWLRLGGPACLSDPSQQARAAEAYFALLDEQSSAGELRDPENFDARLDELFAPPDHRPGIQVAILPIHQAKGLEWDVVFLPALERRARQDDKRLIYWRLRQRGAQGREAQDRGARDSLLLGPMDVPGSAREEDDARRRQRKQATLESYLRGLASESLREELKRLFYVAATRARRRLYLSAAVNPERPPMRDSMLRLLWALPEMQNAFRSEEAAASGYPPAEPAAEERSAEVQSGEVRSTDARFQLSAAPRGAALGERRQLRRLPPELAAVPQPPLPPPLEWGMARASIAAEAHRFEWVGELLPRVGVVAHSFLERIARDGLQRWDAARVASARQAMAAALLHAGVCRGELEQGIALVSEALGKTLADERGRWLLSPHQDHRSELALSAVIGGSIEHVRIDRTFVEDGTRWLIDYKISQQSGGDRGRFLQMQVDKYRPDLLRYVRILRALGAEGRRPLRCALYFSLLGAWCEVGLDGGA